MTAESGTARRPKQPKTKARLEQLITQWQKDSGVAVGRLNLRIAAMMLAGALARAVDPDGEAVFATKGGIAMELWAGGKARATRDIDLVLRGDVRQLTEHLDLALREPYNGFTFRRGEIGRLPLRATVQKVKVHISFGGRVLSSPQVEIAPLDLGDEEFVELPAADLNPVGLDGPDVVLVLDARWQIAQKLHAVTEWHRGRENPRFRDLLDVQLLEAVVASDLVSVRDACERVFLVRDQHSWPPELTVAANWEQGYTVLAREVGFGITDVESAAIAVRGFIARIASA